MLFHVTMTHSTADCPLFHPELREATGRVAEGLSDRAAELGVTVHAAVSGAPAHVQFLLLEADSYEPVARFIALASAFPQEYTITPVVPLGSVSQTVFPSQ